MSCTLFVFMGFMVAMRFLWAFYLLFAICWRHVLFGDKVQLKWI